MNGKNKIRAIENPPKRAGHRAQGIVETQMEIVEVENKSLCTHI